MLLDVALIGAGIAGLTVGYELQHLRPDASFALFEARRIPGGNVRTLRTDYGTVDLGPDAFAPHPADALELCGELGLDGELVSPDRAAASASVIIGEHVHELPEGLVLGLPSRWSSLVTTEALSIRGKLRAALDLVLPSFRGSHPSLGRLVAVRLGREVRDNLVEPVVGGIHGGDIDKLDPGLVLPALADARGGVIRALARARRPASGPLTAGFRAPAAGMHRLVESLAAAIGADRLRPSAEVVRVGRKRSSWELALADGTTARARQVVFACPPRAVARLLADVDLDLATLVSGVRTRALATVALAFDGHDGALPRGSGLLAARSAKVSFLGVTFVHRKWPHRIPNGNLLLRAVVGGARSSELLRESDDDIGSQVEKELRGLFAVGRCRSRWVERYTDGAPQLDIGFRSRVEAARAALENFGSLHLAGAAYDGPGLAGCIRGARFVARSLSTMA